MDDTGQFALGDTNNYLKYFKDTDGNWKLALSAQTITLGTSDKPLDETIQEIQEGLENIDVSVGARNLIRNSKTLIFTDYILSSVVSGDGNGNLTVTGVTLSDDEQGNVTLTGATLSDDSEGNVTMS